MSVIIEPAGSLRQVVLLERGPVQSVWARAVIANLPRHIAERELAVVYERLGWPPAQLEVREAPEARGPGNVLLLAVQTPSLTEIFAAFGQRGVRAEEVAGQAVAAVSRYLEADVPVGEHLADQLLLPMALAGGGSFRTLPLSPHARTNLGVLQIFLDCAAELVPQGEDACLVRVRAPGPWCSASHKP